MTLPTFAEDQKEILWERLEKWQANSSIGMTKEKYLDMEKQLKREPNLDKCPPGIEDFPEETIQALEIFNYLGDRVYPDVGYTGKDYTNLPVLMQIYNIQNKELLLDTLLRLDSEAIKTSQEKIKREFDKVKSKNRGK